MPVGSLFAVLGLLASRTRTMSAGNILFLFGLGLYFTIVAAIALWGTAKHQSTLYYIVNICHSGRYQY